MRKQIWSAAMACALVAGCTAGHGSDGNQTGDNENGSGAVEPGNGSGDGSGSGGTTLSCPLGAASFTSELGLASSGTLLDLAIDVRGDAFAGTSVPEFLSSQDATVAGAYEVSAAGALLAQFPGSLTASDAAGNVYIAGSFTSAITFGNQTLTPEGNIDIFIAKIDGASGRIVFVKQLGLCGDGIESLAVAHDGRIAVSGTALGTVILSASGDVHLSLAMSGLIGFDSHGNLVIAENSLQGAPVTPNFDLRGDALVIEKVDARGNVLASQTINGAIQINGLAIGANDHVALVGFTDQDGLDLFGTSIRVIFVADGPGRIDGGFLVELDANLAPSRVLDLGIVEANAVAFDAQNHVFVAGAYAGDTGFGRYLTAFGVDTRLPTLFPANAGDINGRGTGIVADACGSVIVGYVKQDTVSAASPIRAFLQKVSQ